MKNESDDMPIMIDTMMRIKSSSWNHNGSILAVAGNFRSTESSHVEKDSNVVQFYSTFGVHLRTLKIPGKELTCCAWEGTSLRIALAVDSFIYFANIRPEYKWCYFSNTVVYTFTKPERYEVSVVFWDTKNDEKHIKHVKSLIAVSAYNDYCILATKTDDIANPYGLILCNAIGTPVDSTHIDIKPLAVTMTKTHVFAVSKESIFSWQYYTPKAKSALTLGFVKSDSKKEKVIHIDDNPTGGIDLVMQNDRRFEPTSDCICCVAASDSTLVVGRESGAIHKYTLPHIVLIGRLQHPSTIYRMSLNCNSLRLATIDLNGVLRLTKLDEDSNSVDRNGVDFSKFERKDVWDACWAQDNPELLAVMEKTRMYVFRNLDPEEPIISSGYICCFKDLEISAVLMDNLMKDPEEPSSQSLIHLEVKSLRDTRELLEKVGTKEAIQFIEENPHPRLWKLLAKAALDEIDLETSESSFVRCKDYPGIQFVKKLKNIQSEVLRKAEIAAYFRDFKEAERLYIEADRKDLAIQLRIKLGDYYQVVELLKSANVGSDPQMEQALINLGDHYAERQKWEEAAVHYEKGRQLEKLAHCFIMLDDYDALNQLAESLPDGSPLLSHIAEVFTSLGMCELAVKYYKRNNEIKAAVDCCVRLNQWHEAVQLAKENNVRETSELLAKYANHLLEKNMKLQAIELYRKANHYLEAARLLFQIAEEETKKKSKPLRIKKLYILGALLIDEFQQSANSSAKNTGDRSSALMGLNASDSNTELLDSAWRGAEAYHFYILAQRQLYEGYVDASMKTSLHLRDFEDILLLEDIYALLALASCANRAFGTCSKALTRLESLDKIAASRREEYESLALDIFTKHVPKDSRINKSECTSCETLIPDWCNICPNCNTKFPICIATGRPLMDVNNIWTCSLCKHCASEQDIATRKFCPLCHCAITH